MGNLTLFEFLSQQPCSCCPSISTTHLQRRKEPDKFIPTGLIFNQISQLVQVPTQSHYIWCCHRECGRNILESSSTKEARISHFRSSSNICLNTSQKNSLQVLSNIKKILATNTEMGPVYILKFVFNRVFHAECTNGLDLAWKTTYFPSISMHAFHYRYSQKCYSHYNLTLVKKPLFPPPPQCLISLLTYLTILEGIQNYNFNLAPAFRLFQIRTGLESR